MFPNNVAYHPRHGFGNIQTLQLQLPDGRGECEIWFKSEDQDINTFESSRVNGIWWTECKREAVFDALQPRMAARRGWLLMDYVPQLAWHKFRIRIPSEIEGSMISHMRFAMIDNAHNLAPGEIEYQRGIMSARDARVRIDGEEGSDFGAVYREFDPDRHVCSPFSLENAVLYAGYDYGYRHPSVCAFFAMLPMGYQWPNDSGSCWDGKALDREVAVFFREFYETERTIPTQAAMLRELMKGESYEWNIVADPSCWNTNQVSLNEGKSVTQLFRENGISFKKGHKGAGQGIHAQVALVRKMFEADQIVFFDSCINLIRDHQTWRYKEDRDGKAPTSEPFSDDGKDGCDAVRYPLACNPVATRIQAKIYNVAI